MSGSNPVLQYSDGTTKPQAPGTTLAQIREGQGAACWLEDTVDSCEYRSPDFVLVAGHIYKVLKPDATGTPQQLEQISYTFSTTLSGVRIAGSWGDPQWEPINMHQSSNGGSFVNLMVPKTVLWFKFVRGDHRNPASWLLDRNLPHTLDGISNNYVDLSAHNLSMPDADSIANMVAAKMNLNKAITISRIPAETWEEIKGEFGLTLDEIAPTACYSVHSAITVVDDTHLLTFLNFPAMPHTPYVWTAATETAQMPQCIQYIQAICQHYANEIEIRDVSKQKQVLSTQLGPFLIKGTTDAMICLGPSNISPAANAVVIFELKKQVQLGEPRQILVELLAVNKKANQPCIAIHTNLGDTWQFFWLDGTVIKAVQLTLTKAIIYLAIHMKKAIVGKIDSSITHLLRKKYLSSAAILDCTTFIDKKDSKYNFDIDKLNVEIDIANLDDLQDVLLDEDKQDIEAYKEMIWIQKISASVFNLF